VVAVSLLLNAAFIVHHCSSCCAMLSAASFFGKELLWLQAGWQCDIVDFASGDALASVGASNPPFHRLEVEGMSGGHRRGTGVLGWGGVLTRCVRSHHFC
jgi:hypothetical protein